MLFAGGSPCQGFSKANPNSKGVRDPRSALSWVFHALSATALAHLRGRASVAAVLENIVMKSSAIEENIAKLLGTTPQIANANLWTVCDRDRNFWSSYPAFLLPGPGEVPPDFDAILSPGWRLMWELTGSNRRPRFSCFLRPWPPGGIRRTSRRSGSSHSTGTTSTASSTGPTPQRRFSRRSRTSWRGCARTTGTSRRRAPRSIRLGPTSAGGSMRKGATSTSDPSTRTSETSLWASRQGHQGSRRATPGTSSVKSSGVACSPATPGPIRRQPTFSGISHCTPSRTKPPSRPTWLFPGSRPSGPPWPSSSLKIGPRPRKGGKGHR